MRQSGIVLTSMVVAGRLQTNSEQNSQASILSVGGYGPGIEADDWSMIEAIYLRDAVQRRGAIRSESMNIISRKGGGQVTYANPAMI